ncbi:MAG: hypothetical protein DRQ51_00840 [Gammaproteobacteria bacterium]|nr:MAG: hypothetical protein DRQ51_00840 [Gammaproteobacteria bacterium]
MNNKRIEIDNFINHISKNLYFYALKYLKDEQQSSDSVQDAILKWIEKRYDKKPQDQWRPLIYRILLNNMHDYKRREKLKTTLLGWVQTTPDKNKDNHNADPTAIIEQKEDKECLQPDRVSSDEEFREALKQEINNLPMRQQEAFSLRIIEGHSTADTAIIMNISQGSVMTHLSRANQALQHKLKQYK